MSIGRETKNNFMIFEKWPDEEYAPEKKEESLVFGMEEMK